MALNAGQALTPTAQGVFEALWLEGLEDLSYGVLERALRRTLQTCKYWPVKVADIREQADRGREAYAQADGEIKWDNVLKYIRVYWNPDLPGGASSNAPPISARVTYAIKCAGGLAEIAECTREHLHFKKDLFLEAYTAWETLRRDEHLLPDGPVKALISESIRRTELASQAKEMLAKYPQRLDRPSDSHLRQHEQTVLHQTESIPAELKAQ